MERQLVVMSVYCFSRGPALDSQHPCQVADWKPLGHLHSHRYTQLQISKCLKGIRNNGCPWQGCLCTFYISYSIPTSNYFTSLKTELCSSDRWTECSPQPQRSPSFLPTGNYAEIRMKESLPHPGNTAVAHPIAVCASKPARALLKKNYFSRS